MAAQIQSLRRQDVRGRLRDLLDQIERCPVAERRELLERLHQRLETLGLPDKERRELEKRHPRLRAAPDGPAALG
jgi:hypothetical protein